MSKHSNKTAEEQVEILRKAGVKNMTEFKQTDVNFLWNPYIPEGKVTIIQGDPAGGKTTLALNLIAALSRNDEFFGGHGMDLIRSRTCIYVTAEDGYGDTVVPRLVKAKANLKNVFTIGHGKGFWQTLENLTDTIDILKPSIVVLDPIQAFFGEGDMNRANDVREVMTLFGDIAEAYNCAIVLIGHLNKKSGDNDLYRGLGSIDFVASARSVLQVGRDKGGRRVIKHVKSSLATNGEDLEIVLKPHGLELIPYEPPAIEGKRETQLSKIPEAEKCLYANMGENWWTRQQVIEFLRTEWQITNNNVTAEILGKLDWKQNGKSRLYHPKNVD